MNDFLLCFRGKDKRRDVLNTLWYYFGSKDLAVAIDDAENDENNFNLIIMI